MDTVFQWERETPVEWQDALNRVYPTGDRLADFRIVWEPGEPWDPIQRWIIWQMRTVDYTGAQMRRRRDPRFEGLHHEPPRRNVRWDPGLGTYRKRDGSTAATDRLTYDLYHQTGQYGQRWWVIQGYSGGHRYTLSPTESKALGIDTRGQRRTMPLPGDLRYADFTERVTERIGKIQEVAVWHAVCDRADRMEARWNAEEKAAAEVARGKLADWLDVQWSSTWDEHKGAYKAALRNIAAPTYDQRDMAHHGADDNAQWREQFIVEGS